MCILHHPSGVRIPYATAAISAPGPGRQYHHGLDMMNWSSGSWSRGRWGNNDKGQGKDTHWQSEDSGHGGSWGAEWPQGGCDAGAWYGQKGHGGGKRNHTEHPAPYPTSEAALKGVEDALKAEPNNATVSKAHGVLWEVQEEQASPMAPTSAAWAPGQEQPASPGRQPPATRLRKGLTAGAVQAATSTVATVVAAGAGPVLAPAPSTSPSVEAVPACHDADIIFSYSGVPIDSSNHGSREDGSPKPQSLSDSHPFLLWEVPRRCSPLRSSWPSGAAVMRTQRSHGKTGRTNATCADPSAAPVAPRPCRVAAGPASRRSAQTALRTTGGVVGRRQGE